LRGREKAWNGGYPESMIFFFGDLLLVLKKIGTEEGTE
jgi:hypothetical protein